MKWRDLLAVMAVVALLAFFFTPTEPPRAPEPVSTAKPGQPRPRPRPTGPVVERPTLKVHKVSGTTLEDLVLEVELRCQWRLPRKLGQPAMIQLHKGSYYWDFGVPTEIGFESETGASLQRWKVKLKDLELQKGNRSMDLLHKSWGPGLVANACVLVRYPKGNPVARAPNPGRIWSEEVRLTGL